MGARVIGYVRVSTDEQEHHGVGLEAQEQAILAEAGRRGFELVRIERDVSSGARRDRPGLAAALAAVEAGEVDGLMVTKLDRLSRSVAHFSDLLERFRLKGWGLVILDLGIDTTTIMGEAMATVAATFAQLERRRIGERTREALAVKRDLGVQLGRPPLPADQLLRRVRRMRKRGATLQAIADKLNGEGVPTSRGGSEWRPSSVRAVLQRKAR